MNLRSIHRRGFSLIEVLIGVLVLALGLLGLGAIIPVVIREQRQAVTATLAIDAARAAKEYLLRRPDLDPAMPFDLNTAVNPNTPVATIGWDVWLLDERNWSPTPQYDQLNAYLWEPWHTSGSGSRPQEFCVDPNATPVWATNPGDCGWHINRPGTLGPLDITVTLADRLWPSETIQGELALSPGKDPYRPQFVWDFIGRRVNTAPGEPRQIQIAIFVRQLDLNIRIPRGNHPSGPAAGTPYTLRDVVLNRGLAAPGDARVPVCSQPTNAGATLQYLPTGTGNLPNLSLYYSEPIFVEAETVTDAPPRITFSNRIHLPNLNRADNAWKLISQSGQKVLDNLGNVYTVRGIADELEPSIAGPNGAGSTEIIVDPPVPAWVPESTSAPSTATGTLRQLVFMPQTPAAVEVFTITRVVP